MTDRKHTDQLPLALPSEAAMGRADFLESPSNAQALAALEAPVLAGGLAVLVGPGGAGKTHLAHVWARRVGAVWQDAGTLVGDLPGLLAPGAPSRLVIDDAQRLAGGAGEEALFHLVNHLRGRGELLLTAPCPARDWGLVLPDLLSRLSAAGHPALSAPDEVLLAGVLVKLFADRQVQVDPPLIAYLLARMERSLAAARDLVDRLDRRALALKRPITWRLASEMFAEDLDKPDTGQAS